MGSRDFDPAGSPLRVFGAELRHYRMCAGLSQEQLGARLYCSADLVGKVENGHRAPTPEFTAACDAVTELDTRGALGRLREHLHDHLKYRVYPGWFQGWPDKEAEAKTLRWFEPLLVPGLLQTEDYARALLRTRVGDTEDKIEDMVAARMERQVILNRDKPPTLWAVIDEGVLRRPVGGPEVMGEQVHHLIETAQRPNVVLQVIPLEVGAHEGLRGPFVIADFEDAPSVVYVDTTVRGQVVEQGDDIDAVRVTWDTLMAEALSRKASVDLAEEVAKTSWT
jgi:transcriptional regulator with XRE-family HTH domain